MSLNQVPNHFFEVNLFEVNFETTIVFFWPSRSFFLWGKNTFEIELFEVLLFEAASYSLKFDANRKNRTPVPRGFRKCMIIYVVFIQRYWRQGWQLLNFLTQKLCFTLKLWSPYQRPGSRRLNFCMLTEEQINDHNQL